MSTRRIWITRANGLSLLRMLVAPVLAFAVMDGAAAAAAAFFWLAVATDVADGRVARRRGEVTPYGRLIDHAADATLVSVGTGALAFAGELSVALPPLIAVAFLQYAFDSRPIGIRNLRHSRLGHWNGIAYYVIVGVPVMRDALGLSWPGAALVRAFSWLLVVLTLVSMGDRLRVSLSAE